MKNSVKFFVLFLFIQTIYSNLSAQTYCTGLNIVPPCIGTFSAGLTTCIQGQNQGICLRGPYDSISVSNSSAGTADSFVIGWPFGFPAIEGFQGNFSGCLRRRIPINPDTCVSGGYIPVTVYSAFFQRCSGTMVKVGEQCYTFALYPKPRAEFSSSDTVCLASAVNFYNDCPVNAPFITYHYDFGEPLRTDDTSNVFNPSYTYHAAGTYTVICSVINTICNETAIYQKQVTILPQATIDTILNTTDTLCTGMTIHPVIIARGARSYNINPNAAYVIINGNTDSPTIIFNSTPGLVNIDFNITGCCSNNSCTRRLQFVIEAGPNISQPISIPNMCSNSNVNLNINSFYTSTNANQINHVQLYGPNGSLIYRYDSLGFPASSLHLSAIGSYIITVYASGSCGLISISDTFSIIQPTSTLLPPTDTVCIKTIIHLPHFSLDSIFLDGLFVTDTFFYIDSARIYSFVYKSLCTQDTFIVVGKGIKVNVVDYQVCINQDTVALISNRQGSVFGGMFVWSHFFINPHIPGQYQYICYYLDSSSHCQTTDTAYVDVRASVSGGYTFPDTACKNSLVTFVNNSPDTCRVDFNDGAGSITIVNAYSLQFSQSGKYYISITYISAGCANSFSDSILILPLPDAYFVFFKDTICPGELAQIDSVQLSQDSAKWFLNNNSIAGPSGIIATNTTHGISVDSIKYQISSSSCGTSQISRLFYTKPSPVARFSLGFLSFCDPMEIHYYNQSRGVGLSFSWFRNGIRFSNDSIPRSDTLVAHNIDSIYIYKLVVTSDCGRDSMFDTVIVHPVDFVPCFSPQNSFSQCAHQPMLFTDCMGTGFTLFYNFGDGSYFSCNSNSTVSHIFSNPGHYRIWLKVVTFCKTDSTYRDIIILPAPQVHLDPNIIGSHCSDQPVTFTCSDSIVPPGEYHWFFGDGIYDSLHSNPSHIYASGGIYRGWVYVVGINTCSSDTVFFTVFIDNTPDANIGIGDTSVCTGKSIFLNIPQADTNSVYTWFTLHDLDTIINSRPVGNGEYEYRTDSAGTYSLWMTAYNAYNHLCHSTSAITILNVIQTPIASFTLTVIDSSDTTRTFRFDNGSKWDLSDIWNLGENDTVYSRSPVKLYINRGLYQITLTAVNQMCYAVVTQTILAPVVRMPYTPDAFTPNGDGVNDSFEIYGELEAIDHFGFSVFNRWGEKVFETRDQYFKWDGTYKGQLLNPAVYVYILELSYLGDTNLKIQKGSITILR